MNRRYILDACCGGKMMYFDKMRCRGKHSFDTMAEARHEMARMRLTKSDLVVHRGMKWLVYQCPFCRKRHYTSRGTAKDQEFYARVAKEGANV